MQIEFFGGTTGEAFMAKLLWNDSIDRGTRCAPRASDGTFTDPEDPPAPTQRNLESAPNRAIR